MADRFAGPRHHVDTDGVRTIEGSGVRTSVWLLALAMALVSVALFFIVRPALRQNRTPAAATHPPAVAAHTTLDHPTAPPLRAPTPPRLIARAQAKSVPAAPQPERPPPRTPQLQPDYNAPAAAAAEADQDQTTNEPRGIAVFPPPGTKPVVRGIVVPDGFELPPGYIRHYQTTDDGHQLPPILMFHPDYHPVDARGNPISLPADRVVPPDMAPPGMPVQMLDVPDNQPATNDSPRGGRGPLPNP